MSTLKDAVLGAVPPGGGATGLLSKVIETPRGVSENDKDTGALKLFTDPTVINAWPEPPCRMVSVSGEIVRVNDPRS